MYRLYRLLLVVLLTLVASPAFGQYTRDTAAKKKIDEAINKYYVETDFEKAEGVLLGTINACGDKCSPQTHGSAWMYVGIVRGSGKNNQAGAKEAFQKAVAADPQVKLDMVLATPETQATFAAVSGSGAAPVEAPSAPIEAVPAGGGEGGLACTPEVREVETRRPIPIQCQSDEEVTGMEIKYKPFGSDTWKTLPMSKKGEAYRATIPCDGTGIAGTLRVYVRAKDAQGEQLDSWGSKQAPVEFNLAEGVTAEPPAFEGEAAPARCQDKGECPPDFPGCSDAKSSDGCEGRGQKDWGAACDNSVQCKCGLLCTDGTCETAPSCETDADCSTGTCQGGKCDIEGGSGGGFGPKEPFKKNWFGIHLAQDFAFVGGNNVCDATLGQADANYACFYEGTDDQPFFRTPFPYRDGIESGMVLATTRVMLSYDRAFTNRITLGVRLGYAFGGGPPAGQSASLPAEQPVNGDPTDSPWQVPANNVATGGTPFLPVHAEVRGAFWFLPLNAKMFRAYAALGGGMAQVDAKVSIPELDCNDATEPRFTEQSTGQEYSAFAQCQNAVGYYDYRKYPTYNIDGWKKMGQGFITGAVGGMIAFKDDMGVLINANVMYMLPAAGIVIEPSLGFTIGM